MQLLLITKDHPALRIDEIGALPPDGWLWIDASVSEQKH